MFSFRFALVPFVLSMFAVTSAFAAAGSLTVKVTPVSDTVTYSVPSASPPLNMLIGYTMKFTNSDGNTINNVNITFSIDNAAAELVESGLPTGCGRVSGTNSLRCTVTQMKSGASFPANATGAPFVFFYKSPTDPTPTVLTDTTVINSKVRTTYAEATNGSNPAPNSDIESTGPSVTLGTVNDNTIKSAISKNGGALQTGNAGIPNSSTTPATELLVVPQLPGFTQYTAAAVVIDLITGTNEAQCLNLGHFIQCPIFSTSVPTDPTVVGSPPLQFTSTPLSMTYRIHPSNLKMSAAQILNSVQIYYQKDGETGFQLVTDICPSAGTSNGTGRPCIAPTPKCYKSNNAPTPALVGVCEWKLNNTENGLIKVQ